MPVYSYKALSETGGPEAGIIDADSPKDARLKLKGRHLHVTELEPMGGAARKGEKRVARARFLRSRRPEDVAMITRQMATLLGSGIPMIGTLTAVIEQVESRDLKASLMDVRERVSQGGSLSDAMAVHSLYFPELYVNMVRAGEAGGNLDRILFRLADYLHAQNRTRARVTAALTYPIIMLLVGVVVVAVLLTYVVPKIMEVIQKQQGAALPLPTVMLMAVSGFMGRFWWAVLAAGGAAFLVYARARATPGGRLRIDRIKLGIPVVGNLMRKASISRFAVTFGTLLESGLPVLDSLAVVKRVVDNAVLAAAIDTIRQRVGEGADISTPLKQSNVFPPVVGYMISVGEESGRLEDLLKKIASSYDEEVEVAAQKLTSLLEPLMIVLMAGVVGFIVMAIMLPILQMSNI